MKPGTIVRLPDGREGTVVYHGLDGYGIQWGRKDVDVDKILSGDGNCFMKEPPAAWQWEPEAMLRERYSSAPDGIDFIGDEYDVVGVPK